MQRKSMQKTKLIIIMKMSSQIGKEDILLGGLFLDYIA
jgi:hypothetical protein